MAVIRSITIEPGENTGWHYHPTQVQAVVVSGTLTRVLADGSVVTTRPGESLVELAGPDQVHIGINHEAEPVVILANFEEIEGCPFAVQVLSPSAALQDRADRSAAIRLVGPAQNP